MSRHRYNMAPHRYDHEGATFDYRPEPAWKSDPLLESPAVKDWVYHLGSDEKKLSYLDSLRKFLEFTGKSPEDLVDEAASSKGYAIDDKLKKYLANLEQKGLTQGECVEYYLGARSFFVWNGFIEKLRSIPPKFRKVVATNAYNWYSTLDK